MAINTERPYWMINPDDQFFEGSYAPRPHHRVVFLIRAKSWRQAQRATEDVFGNHIPQQFTILHQTIPGDPDYFTSCPDCPMFDPEGVTCPSCQGYGAVLQ